MALPGEEFFFYNDFEHTLDSQRRIAIPSEWRYQGAESRFVIIPARDSILQLYTYPAFQEMILSKVKKMSPANALDTRALAILGSRTQPCTCDKQGRIQLSAKLVAYAGLKDKAVLNGSMLYAEILTPEKWAQRGVYENDDFLDLLERLHGKES